MTNSNRVGRFSKSSEEIALRSARYNGLIFNKEQKVKLAIVNINGKESLVKPRDVLDGYTIVKFDLSSLTVNYKGKKINIPRRNP